MSISTLDNLKAASQTYPTLLLATIAWDSTTLYLSTLAVTYGGHDYLGLLSAQDLNAVQAMDGLGIDRIPQATLHIADASGTIWRNYQMDPTLGFKGATMTLTLIGWDPDTSTATSDAKPKFVGPCQPPDHDAKEISLPAQAEGNAQQRQFPVQIQQVRCGKLQPLTAAQRLDSHRIDSPFHACGLDPAIGRGTSTDPCGQTRDGCIRVGNAIVGGRGAFDGVPYSSELYWRGKSYAEKKTIQGSNPPVDKFGKPFPVVLGTAWVDGAPQDVSNEANSSRSEVVVCAQKLKGTKGTDPGSILKVLYGQTEVPFRPYSPDQKLFGWDWINNGARDGFQNTDAEYVDAAGVPQSNWYGGLSAIEVVVPTQLAGGGSTPQIHVLVDRPFLPKYQEIASITASGTTAVATLVGANVDIASNETDYTIIISGNSNPALNGQFVGLTSWSGTTVTFNVPGLTGSGSGGYIRYEAQTDNPIWGLAYVYAKASISNAALGIPSFIAAAAICDPQISYIDSTNASVNVDADGSPHRRFRMSAAFGSAQQAADVITGIRNSVGAYVDIVDGLLNVRLRGPLTEQQPAAITGSNNSSPFTSKLRDGTTANGYSAFSFNRSNILVINKEPALSATTEKNSPNQLSFEFQDRDNQWQTDRIQNTYSPDAQRMGAVIPQNFNCIGPNTADQCMRVTTVQLDEIHSGNPAGSGGSLWYKITSTVKVEHLRPGHIVDLTEDRENLAGQLFRVMNVSPKTDFTEATVTVRWHEDDWYLDTNGQTQSQTKVGNNNRSANRAPYPWGPALIPPQATDSLFAATDYTFDVEPNFDDTARDGTVNPQIFVNGTMPVDSFGTALPPVLATQASVTGSSGPFIGPASFYIKVCARDSNGKYSAPSQSSRADIASGSVTSLTVAVPIWGPGTAGWAAFVSDDSRILSLQATGSGTPSSITISTYKVSYTGLPDVACNSMRVRNKKVIVPGVFTGEVSAVTSTTIKVAGAAWTTNQWVGRVVTDYSVPYVANYAVTANTVDTLTVTGNPAASPGISRPYSKQSAYAQAVNIGDIIVIRAQVSVSGNVLTDSSWALDTTGNGVIGTYVRIIAKTGRGKTAKVISNTLTSVTTEPFSVTLDATSVPIIEAPNWLYVADHDPFLNSDIAAGIGLICPVDNFDGHAVGVQVFTVAADGTESLADISPFRDLWIGGADGTTGGQSAPGPILGLTQVGSTDLTTDPAFALVTVQYSQPTSLNGFDSTQFYVTYAGYATPVTGPLTNFLGSSPQTDVIRIPRPTAAGWTSPVLWGTSSSATYFNPLVVAAGPTQTPHISLATITTFTGATSPVATLPSSTATALIVISSVATGATRWGMKVTVTAPTGGWAANNVYYLKGQAKQIGGAGVVSFLWKSFSIPSGSTSFVAEADVSFWRPAYSPTGAFDESWEAEVTASNIEDIPGAVITSAPVPVVGGGDATPAPNPTSITNTFDYGDEGNFFVNTVWTFPTTTYQFVNYFIPTLYAYQPPPGGTTIVNSPVGNMGRFDFFDFGIPARFNPSTGAFSWRHGPYERNTVAQDYAVTALCFSGIGVDTASPIVSAPFTIQPVPTNHSDTSMIVSALAVTRNSPVLRDVDGSPQMAFTASFTNPSNTTDAYAIHPTVRNILDSNDVERPTGMDFVIGDNGGPGATLRKIGFGPWTEYIGTYRFTFYTVNALGDRIGGTAPFIDVPISSATAGGILLNRGAAASLTSTQMVSGIIDSLRLVANAGLTIFKTVAGLPTLPDPNYPPGCTVVEIASKKLYFNTGVGSGIAPWQLVSPSDVLTGLLGDPDISTGALNFNKLNQSTVAIVDSMVAANTISFNKLKNSTVIITDTMFVANTINFNKLLNSSITITDSMFVANTINFNKIQNSTFSINATSVTLVGQWSDGQLSGIAAGKLTAGTVNVTIVLNAATINSPIINVTGGTFTVAINVTDGVLVTSPTNSSSVSLQPGYVRVSGIGGATGTSTIVQSGQVFLSGSGGTAVTLSCGFGTPQITVTNGAGGGIGLTSSVSFGTGMTSTTAAAFIRLTGAGSVCNINGTYQLNGTTVIDSSGRLNGPDAGPVTIGGTTFPHSLAVVVSGTLRQMGTS